MSLSEVKDCVLFFSDSTFTRCGVLLKNYLFRDVLFYSLTVKSGCPYVLSFQPKPEYSLASSMVKVFRKFYILSLWTVTFQTSSATLRKSLSGSQGRLSGTNKLVTFITFIFLSAQIKLHLVRLPHYVFILKSINMLPCGK